MSSLTAHFVVTDDVGTPRFYLNDGDDQLPVIRFSDEFAVLLGRDLADPIAWLRRLSADADELADEMALRSIEAGIKAGEPTC